MELSQQQSKPRDDIIKTFTILSCFYRFYMELKHKFVFYIAEETFLYIYYNVILYTKWVSIIKGGAFFYFISMQQEQELYRKRRGHEGPLKKESKIIWRVRRKRRLACTPTDEKKRGFPILENTKKKPFMVPRN